MCEFTGRRSGFAAGGANPQTKRSKFEWERLSDEVWLPLQDGFKCPKPAPPVTL